MARTQTRVNRFNFVPFNARHLDRSRAISSRGEWGDPCIWTVASADIREYFCLSGRRRSFRPILHTPWCICALRSVHFSLCC